MRIKTLFIFLAILIGCVMTHIGLSECVIGDAAETNISNIAADVTAGDLQYNEFEWKVLALLNRERINNGAQPLTMASAMQNAADVRAAELLSLFSHTRPDGRSCFSALDDAGVPYFTAGENIAMGYRTPADVMRGWMNSPGHRSNILDPDYCYVGVGYNSSSYCWVQLFASVYNDEISALTLDCADVRVAKGTAIDAMGITASYESTALGHCACPLISEMCTGYDPNADGTQTVTVSIMDLSAAFTVTTISRPAKKVTLDKEEIHFDVLRGSGFGQTKKLNAALSPEDCDSSLVWSSSDASVATVDQNGTVTSAGYGNCRITAAASSAVKAVCAVSVNEIVQIESIIPDNNAVDIPIGKSRQLSVTILPSDATNMNLNWTSADPRIVKVDAAGLLKSVSMGETVITVSAKDGGGASAEISVRVTGKAVSKITLNKLKVSLKAGETIKLMASVSPKDAHDKTITWSSSDDSVAAVNKNGKVKAVAPGKCSITATSANGLEAVCRVTVKAVKTTSIRLVKKSAKIVIKAGENLGKTLQLKAEIKPTNATDKSVTWSTSNSKVATVDKNGTVTSVGIGKCTITAKASGGQKAKCVIAVSKKPVKSIMINGDASMRVGDTQTLTAVLLPKDAFDANVKWRSGNPKIAAVDENGFVIALKKGKVIITCTAADGSKVNAKLALTVKTAK